MFANHAGATTGNGNLILSTVPFIATASYLLPVSRSAVDATIDVDGRVINIVSTHLDADNATHRINEITALLPWAVTFAEDRIVPRRLQRLAGHDRDQEHVGRLRRHLEGLRSRRGTATGDGITHGSHRIDYVFLSKKASFLKLVSMEIFQVEGRGGRHAVGPRAGARGVQRAVGQERRPGAGRTRRADHGDPWGRSSGSALRFQGSFAQGSAVFSMRRTMLRRLRRPFNV